MGGWGSQRKAKLTGRGYGACVEALAMRMKTKKEEGMCRRLQNRLKEKKDEREGWGGKAAGGG